MKPDALPPQTREIELKLALPSSDVSNLATRLARTPALMRRKPTHQHLYNVYYDTPDQLLRQQRVALRLRRVGSESRPQWLQTLKTGDDSFSALSQRGEWEASVPGAALSLEALKATPWPDMDRTGSLFESLSPCFVTRFERTQWTVRKRDGSVIEVALDIGQLMAGDKSAPICELELELRAGQPGALFDLAAQIARTVAVLPANMSKSQRGYALAQDELDLPQHAQRLVLKSDLTLPELAARVLREIFSQFTANLLALRTSDNPELVHQARIAWRRFKSAVRLFRPILDADSTPSWQALQPLLSFMSELRDLDVARTETLAPLAQAYMAGNDRRALAWQAMTQELLHATVLQRKAVRYALEEPAMGACLLATTRWLEESLVPKGQNPVRGKPEFALRYWVSARILRLHKQWKRACQDTASPDLAHQARILAKRLRYNIESLRDLVPKRRARRWGRQATDLQMHIGARRDMMQALALVTRLEVDPGLVEFLRGVAHGQDPSASQ